eukprot:TRINITY_DN781810_c0_g1_i1.p1 TRINITY_DN781810_c0_g1~~TRINITY_DN781810_c0_g1_i1.p1  ORF type:complete len:214 (-),score=33.48 TRINITY_DN781810_c0_g1_i1:98-739(-)
MGGIFSKKESFHIPSEARGKWSSKQLRKLIDKKAIHIPVKGSETPFDNAGECPICDLFFLELNRTKCCHQELCSDCLLSYHSPKFNEPCMFCKGKSCKFEAVEEDRHDQMKKFEKEQEQLTQFKEEIVKGKINLISKDEEKKQYRKLSEGCGERIIDDVILTTQEPHRNTEIENNNSEGITRTIRQLEDLMLMEAIRRSLHPNGEESTDGGES